MWDEQRRQRLQHLREREFSGLLQRKERQELAFLMDELQTAEAEYLKPATQHVREECEKVEDQNVALESLVRRKEDLAQRLEDVLTEAQKERLAIEGELAAVLVGNTNATSDD